MTDKTKLVAIARTDDMSALDALKLLRFRRLQYGQKSVKGHECLVCMVRRARSDLPRHSS